MWLPDLPDKLNWSLFILRHSVAVSVFHVESFYINLDILVVAPPSLSTIRFLPHLGNHIVLSCFFFSRKATNLNKFNLIPTKLRTTFFHSQVHLLWWDWPERRHGVGHSLRSQEVHRPSPGASLRQLPGDQPEREERLCLTLPELSLRGARADAALLGGDWCPGWAGATLGRLLRHWRPDPGEHPTARDTQHKRDSRIRGSAQLGWRWVPKAGAHFIHR